LLNLEKDNLIKIINYYVIEICEKRIKINPSKEKFQLKDAGIKLISILY